MSVKHLCVCLAVVAQGCWTDFPDSRLDDDGGLRRDSGRVDMLVVDARPRDQRPPLDAPRMDRGGAEAAVDAAQPDVHPMDATDDEGVSCQPNQFVRCEDDTLVTCNASGTGTVESACEHGCSEVLRDCRDCDPDAYRPRCQPIQGGGAFIAITCDSDGRIVTTPCPDGCDQGICCTTTDGDGDGESDCQGDCDDDDDRAHTKQEGYFIKPRDDGSFDFNCDLVEEMILDKTHDCPRTCPDMGWVSQVPECGKAGKVIQCTRSIVGPNPRCDTGESADNTQACR